MLHKELVDQRFEHHIESDERFCPIVCDEQCFDDFTERLPHRVGLPQSPAVGSKPRVDFLKLPDAVSDSLNATHLVGRLKCRCDRDASAGSHLAYIRRDHLKTVCRVSKW